MEIEEVAAKDPDAILKEYVDPTVGCSLTRHASWHLHSA